MESVDAVVVGAGVVGLATARALARSGRQVLILERESAFGTHTSSRNSEVIHAGIYYPEDSLKAKLCVAGRERLFDYVVSHGIGHRRCGKLIVATESCQQAALERIAARARGVGVELSWMDGPSVMSLEPGLTAELALFSPYSGIVDSHGLMLSLLGEAEDAGALFVTRSEVVRALVQGSGGFELSVDGPDGRVEIGARCLVNAAGLFATEMARRVEGLAAEWIPETRFAKGNYFSLVGRVPFTRLIYPVPNEAGLGVHLTLDLAGRARFGPDVEWVSSVDYQVSASREALFYEEIRAYWPGLPDGALVADYCGVRPKLVGEGDRAGDFRIDGPTVHGVEGLVNLFGIESPGLTSCLALADEVVRSLGD